MSRFHLPTDVFLVTQFLLFDTFRKKGAFDSLLVTDEEDQY